MNENEILYALKVAAQYIDITDSYEEIEIDGEMLTRYEIKEIIEKGIELLNNK